MSKVSRDTAANVEQHGPVEDRHDRLDDYTVNFVSFHEQIDAAPLLRGLPGDMCQCPHWGYVLKGQLTFTYGDRVEVVEAGDAYYNPPGHSPMAEAGSEIVQFSPTAQLRVTEEAMVRNALELQGA